MTNEQIEKIALANGFTRRKQVGGEWALNHYVFTFARALLAAAKVPQPPEDTHD